MPIRIDNLSFRYKANLPLVLNGVSMAIEDGSLTVLLGLNGCGKTTLIKLLAGLEKPSEGAIYYGERDLSSISIKERSKTFAYVSQHANVAAEIPVRQYLLYGTTNTLAFYQRPGEEQMKLVERAAERFQISHLLDKNLGQISGGELQIALIACAIIQNTPIVLLDEPTSALDIKNQSLVLSALKEIAKEENKTIILSTHNPNHALFLSSDVIFIHEGGIKAHGDAKNLIKKEMLRPIYGDRLCFSEELQYKEISFR